MFAAAKVVDGSFVPLVREAGAGSVNLGPWFPRIRVGINVGEACRGHAD